MRRPFRVTPPAAGILNQSGDLRPHVRVDDAVEGALIDAYVQAAVDLLDGYSGILSRCILAQRWAFPVPLSGCELCLPFPDCRGMTVEQYDGTDFSPVAGAVITEGFDRITITGLPNDRSDIYVLLTAGWATAADVPGNLKQAIRMLVAHWYENRETVVVGTITSEVQFGVDQLLQPLKSI